MTKIFLNESHIAERSFFGNNVLRDDIRKWCRETLKSPWTYYSVPVMNSIGDRRAEDYRKIRAHIVIIEDDAECILFKLKWNA